MNKKRWLKLIEADWKAVFFLDKTRWDTFTLKDTEYLKDIWYMTIRYNIGDDERDIHVIDIAIAYQSEIIGALERYIDGLRNTSKRSIILSLNDRAKELLKDPKYDLDGPPPVGN